MSVPTPRGHGDDGWQGTRWHASQCAAPGHRRPGSLGAGLEDARAAHADARPAAAGGPDLRAVLLCVPGLLAGPREPRHRADALRHGVHDWIRPEALARTGSPAPPFDPDFLERASGADSIAAMLSREGYRCGMVGKWHVGSSDRPAP